MFRLVSILKGVLIGTVLLPIAAAAEPKSCAEVTTTERNFEAVYSGSAFMTAVLLLEKQGKGKITPAFAEPKASCLAEAFQSSGYTVTASYSGFQPGERTLLYRFAAQKDGEEREVLVLFSGLVSLVQEGGPHFYVIETRNGRTSYYAMYREEPAYAALKQTIEEILADAAKPLIAVEWPIESDELVVVAYDSERLTK